MSKHNFFRVIWEVRCNNSISGWRTRYQNFSNGDAATNKLKHTKKSIFKHNVRMVKVSVPKQYR